jgi:O-antigen ligase
MSEKFARRLLVVAAFLIVWGPPPLRLVSRDLDAVFVDPLALDAPALLQVGTWVFADALVLLLLISHIARRTHFLSELLADRPLRWYALYGMFALASVAWSISWTYTAYFAHKIVFGILVLALLEWHCPRRQGSRALQVLFVVFSLQAAAICILYFVRRDWVTLTALAPEGGPIGERVTGGIFSDYGSSALFAGLFFLSVVLFGRKPVYRLLAGAAYVATWALIVLSQTRATMAAGVAFLLVMLHAHPRARVHGALIATGVAVAIAGLLPAALNDIVSVATRRGEGLDTLSGRTDAFAFLIEHWRDSPILGYGFGSGARYLLIDFVAREGLLIGAGHDVVSTVLVDLGVIGLWFLLMAYVSAWLAAGRLYRDVRSNMNASVPAHQIVCLLIWVTFNAVVDKGLAGGSSQVFVVALVATWTLRRQALARPWERQGAAPVGANAPVGAHI